MPSTRYTVRLPPPFDALVQERIRTSGTPFAVLIREACQPNLPTPADSADTLSALQARLADVTTRVKVLEEILTQWPQLADRGADTVLTGADSEADTAPTAPPTRRGQWKLTPRQVWALRELLFVDIETDVECARLSHG